MKLLFNLILVILYLNSVSSAPSCPSCVDKGDTCSRSYIAQCKNGLQCGTPTSESQPYDEDKLKCIESTGVNSECFDNYNCDLGLQCYKENNSDVKGKCLNINFALIGENCTSTLDCFQNKGSNYSECVNNVCTRVNIDNCNFEDALCPMGQYCVKNDCVNPFEIGENCDSDKSRCNMLTSFCDSTSKKCVKQFSLSENSACTSTDQCDYTKNLVCDFGVCKVNNFKPSTIKNCNSDKQCNANLNSTSSDLDPQTTVCNCLTGDCDQQAFSQEEAKAIVELYECMNKAKCGMFIVEESESSCIYKNCPKQYCNRIALNLDTEKCNPYSKYYDQRCSDYSNFSIKLLPSLSLLLITLIYILI